MALAISSTIISLLLAAPEANLTTAAAAPAGAYAYDVEGTVLWITAPDGNRYRAQVPCEGSALMADDSLLYVACGDAGVAVFSVTPRSTPQLVAVRDLGGWVRGFHASDGRIWAEVVRTDARLLSAGPAPLPHAGLSMIGIAPAPATGSEVQPTAAPSLEPQPGVDAAPALGRVVDLRSTSVVIDLGTEHGLALGDRVSLFSEEKVDLGRDVSPGTRAVIRAVGIVSAVTGTRAEVELGRNETVPAGALARRTTAATTASSWLPPRAADLWEVAITVRPFLALGSFGLGTVNDARLGLRMQQPLHIEALFEPLGVGFADEGNIVAAAANMVLAYDTRLFEVGLGAGWSAVNNDIESNYGLAREDSLGAGIQPEFKNVRSGLSLAQVARLGARDGLHIAVRNTFLYYKEEFHYGGTVGEIVSPVSSSSWLLARGGGGASGFWLAELGLRLLLWGNGGRDSFFVLASLGGAGLLGEKKVDCTYQDWETGASEQRKCPESFSYAGPMVGLGVEWRL